MATLALAVAGAAVGGAILPAGISVLGATVTGATIGAQIGAFAGSYVDQALFGSTGETRVVEGPRLRDLHVTTSSEGAAIPRIFGRVRLGGQVIWATDFEEVVRRTGQSPGGGKGAPSAPSYEQVDYSYYANFAVAFAEGETTSLLRVWADGEEIDLSKYTTRFYTGSHDQMPDPLISSVEGAGNAPAFRGVSYIVFERLPLANFGNRLPQLSFEVLRLREDVINQLKGIVIIPGSGEFVYGTTGVVRQLAPGASETENEHALTTGTDFSASMGQLQAVLPRLENASLIVSWFGDDLRAGHCEVRPKIDSRSKSTKPYSWSVSGLSRASAELVSLKDGVPAYGGTPSDRSVIEAIQDLTARGISVTLTPFLLMDIAEENALASPYGGASQPAYPWRGRITCDPAPGADGSPDQTADAALQIARFVGSASAGDFRLSGGGVAYHGPQEWSYRRMVLHLAFLARAAGGVDAFLLGSELRGLGFVRSAAGTFPFVDELVSLAGEVKAVLGAHTKVSYAADWSEYFGFHADDGSGDHYFHLDKLWSSADVDAVAIDCYWPLSDWRDGDSHADAAAGARSIYDLDYLSGNIAGGEGFDWYYASGEDRDDQVRTLITDGEGEPWVFRFKDIKGWWENTHHDRPSGVRSQTPTSWVPQSKPFWFTEVGCPAVDVGANQPNVFVDPKSSETALPYHSSGGRDDFIQRRYLEAFISYFTDDADGGLDQRNPVSPVYGGRMVELGRVYAYCWDARPFPAFPNRTDVWSDGANWSLGHWLNGRIGAVSLSKVVETIVSHRPIAQMGIDTRKLEGLVPGYVIDRVMSARDALQPLSLAYFFDGIESGERIRFQHRHNGADVGSVARSVFVDGGADVALLTLTRGQESDLPGSAKISYITSEGDYQQAVAEARRLAGASGRVAQAEVPIVLDAAQARKMAESWLHESWVARETATFGLPGRFLAVEPGDVVRVETGAGSFLYRVTEIADAGARQIRAIRLDRRVYSGVVSSFEPKPGSSARVVGSPDVLYVDLPLMTGNEEETLGYVAAYQSPWPGGVAVYASPGEAGFQLRLNATRTAVVGELLDDLPAGAAWRFDWSVDLRVAVRGGELVSADQVNVLAGANALAIRHGDGRWEVLQYAVAVLEGAGVYRLRGLLRGQAGTDAIMADNGVALAGARFVVVNDGLMAVPVSPAEIKLPLNWQAGPVDKPFGDESFVAEVHAFVGAGLRPYAPVHVRARRTADGTLVSWIRRTRKGGDNWDQVEVPLGEDSEAYDVDVFLDESVLRTWRVAGAELMIGDDEMLAMFGNLPSQLKVAVFQISQAWGRGAARTVVVDIS